jgi:hypothetical protein
MKKNPREKYELSSGKITGAAALRLYRHLGSPPTLVGMGPPPVAHREENPRSLSDLFALFSYPMVRLEPDRFKYLAYRVNLYTSPILSISLAQALNSAQSDETDKVEYLRAVVDDAIDKIDRPGAEITLVLKTFKKSIDTYAAESRKKSARDTTPAKSLRDVLGSADAKKYVRQASDILGTSELEEAVKSASVAILEKLALAREIPEALKAIKSRQEKELADIEKTDREGLAFYTFNKLSADLKDGERRIVGIVKEDLEKAVTEGEADFNEREVAQRHREASLTDDLPLTETPYSRALYLVAKDLREAKDTAEYKRARLEEHRKKHLTENSSERGSSKLTIYLNEIANPVYAKDEDDGDSEILVAGDYVNRELVAPGKYIPEGENAVDEAGFKDALRQAIVKLSASIVCGERGDKLGEAQNILNYVYIITNLVSACGIQYGNRLHDINAAADELFLAARKHKAGAYSESEISGFLSDANALLEKASRKHKYGAYSESEIAGFLSDANELLEKASRKHKDVAYSESEIAGFLSDANTLLEKTREITKLVQIYTESRPYIKPDTTIKVENENLFLRRGLTDIGGEGLFSEAKTRLAVSDIEERKAQSAQELKEPDYLDDYVVGRAYSNAVEQIFSEGADIKVDFSNRFEDAIPVLYYSYLNTKIEEISPGSSADKAFFAARLNAIKKGNPARIDDPGDKIFLAQVRAETLDEFVRITGITKLVATEDAGGVLGKLLKEKQEREEEEGERVDIEELLDTEDAEDLALGDAEDTDEPLDFDFEGTEKDTDAPFAGVLEDTGAPTPPKSPTIPVSRLTLNSNARDADVAAILKSVKAEKIKPNTVGWSILSEVLTNAFYLDLWRILRGPTVNFTVQDTETATQEALKDIFVERTTGGANPSIIDYEKNSKQKDEASFINWMVRRARQRQAAIRKDSDRGFLSGLRQLSSEKMLSLGKKSGSRNHIPLYIEKRVVLRSGETREAEESAERLVRTAGSSNILEIANRELLIALTKKYSPKDALNEARQIIEDYEDQAAGHVTKGDYAAALYYIMGAARETRYDYNAITKNTVLELGIKKGLEEKFPNPKDISTPAYEFARNEAVRKAKSSAAARQEYTKLGMDAVKALPLYVAVTFGEKAESGGDAEPIEFMRVPPTFVSSPPILSAYLPDTSIAFRETPTYTPESLLSVSDIIQWIQGIPAELTKEEKEDLTEEIIAKLTEERKADLTEEGKFALFVEGKEGKYVEAAGDKGKFVEVEGKFVKKRAQDKGKKTFSIFRGFKGFIETARPVSISAPFVDFADVLGEDVETVSGEAGDSARDVDIRQEEGTLITGAGVFGVGSILSDDTAFVSPSDFKTLLTRKSLQLIENRADPSWALGVRLFKKKLELEEKKGMLDDPEVIKLLESHTVVTTKGEKKTQARYYVVGPELISRAIAGDLRYAHTEGRFAGKTPKFEYIRDSLAQTQQAILGIWDHLIDLEYKEKDLADSPHSKDALDVRIFREVTKFVPGGGSPMTPYLFERPRDAMNKYRAANLDKNIYYLIETRVDPYDASSEPVFDFVCFNLMPGKNRPYLVSRFRQPLSDLYIPNKAALAKNKKEVGKEFRYCMAQLDLSDEIFAGLFPKKSGGEEARKKVVALYDKKKSVTDNFITLDIKDSDIAKIVDALIKKESARLGVAFIAAKLKNRAIAAARKISKKFDLAASEARYTEPREYNKFLKIAEESYKLAIDADPDDLPDDVSMLVDGMPRHIENGIALLRRKGAFDIEEFMKAKITFAEFYYLQAGRVKESLDAVFERIARRALTAHSRLINEQAEFEAAAAAAPLVDGTDDDEDAKTVDKWALKRKIKDAPRQVKRKATYWEHY